MKRDFDLIRQIMRDIEDLPAGSGSGTPSYQDVDRQTVTAHVILLIDAGLVNGKVLTTTQGPRLRISGLTWAGYDFLAVAKDDTMWAKAKKTVLAPAAGATWAVVLEWMKAESMKHFGLS